MEVSRALAYIKPMNRKRPERYIGRVFRNADTRRQHANPMIYCVTRLWAGSNAIHTFPKRTIAAALATASAEMKWLNASSVAGTFAGQFSSVRQSYSDECALCVVVSSGQRGT
jgi:hypothetical protein